MADQREHRPTSEESIVGSTQGQQQILGVPGLVWAYTPWMAAGIAVFFLLGAYFRQAFEGSSTMTGAWSRLDHKFLVLGGVLVGVALGKVWRHGQDERGLQWVLLVVALIAGFLLLLFGMG